MSSLSRRDLLRMSMAAPLLGTPNLLAQRGGRRLNVLVLAVDDLNNRIACYGDPVVRTPNLDRLAARGVRFSHAYCNYPLCNPSRTSLLSGRRPEVTQVYENYTAPRTYLGNAVFLPEHFKAHGYFTARVGKIAHGRYEHQFRWDISESKAGVGIQQDPPVGALRDKPGRDSYGGGLTDEDDMFEPPQAKVLQREAPEQGKDEGGKLSWTATDGSDADEEDGATARRIVQLINENKDKPFFIGCGFHKPHLPWVAPRKYFDVYSLDQIKLPNTPPDDRDDIPPIALSNTPGAAEMSDVDRRKAILAYHAATTFMDAQLGLVLDAMDQNKLWDNTVVLMFGDHGWHLHDHLQLWRKGTVFEQAARAPLMVAAPGVRPAVSQRLVEFVDIFPTLTELCGLPAAAGLEGSSFAPLLRDPKRPWKKAAYTMVVRGKRFGRSVRTEHWRYTEWEDGKAGVEFYDHDKDPNEWTNIAWPKRERTPKQIAGIEELKHLLHADKKLNVPPKGW